MCFSRTWTVTRCAGVFAPIPAPLDVPVLQLSGAYRRTEDRVRGLEHGADAYLTQPVEPEELVATIRALLRVRRAETDIRHIEARYRGLLDTAVEGIWSIGVDGRTSYVNPRMAAMLGAAAAEDIVGRPAHEVVERDSRAALAHALAGSREGSAAQHAVRLRRRDGSHLSVIMSATPMTDEHGRSSGMLALVTEVTDGSRAEREAGALRWVASLANAAAHEINNPLTVIMGTLELMDREAQPDTRTRARIERALAAVWDIRTSVRRLSRITRMELADQPAHLPPMLDLRRSSAEGEQSPAA